MITGREMRRDKFLLLVSFHIVFLFAFIASLLLRKNDGTIVNNYFFLAFICSGLLLSGLAWRSKAPILLRCYFSIFMLTIPLFLISPSTLLNFLLTMHFSGANGPVYKLNNKYLVETQSSSRTIDNNPLYKLTLKKGFFHQTIQRDIAFGGKLDSVIVLEIENETMLLRGFTSRVSYVSTEIDSMDVKVLLKKVKYGDVEYRL